MSRVYDKTLIDDMVRHLSLPMPLAKQSAEEILTIIHEGLMRDGVVNVTNFGTFRLKPIAARIGFNPNTRERITIPAHQRVVFSPAKALRDQAEPQREPSVPIESEERDAPTVAMSAPVAAILDMTDEPGPPVVDENLDEVLIAGLKHRLDSESFQPSEGDTSQQPVNAPVVEEQAAESISTTNEQEHGAVTVPASAHQENGDRTGSEKIGTIDEEKAAYSSTKWNYFLGVAATLLLGLYIAFNFRETAPDALSATGAGDVPLVLAAASGGDDSFINQTNIPNAAAEPVSAAVNEAAPTPLTQASHFYFKEQTFEIARGESLWRLAEKHYRDAYLWPHIYQANTTAIANPDYLIDGETIVVPGLEGSPDALSEKDRYNIARGYYLTYLFYSKVGRSDALLALRVARRYDANVVENYR
jgi:nucleoid DNA-binding protein/nucleoid-associated protein YgaU